MKKLLLFIFLLTLIYDFCFSQETEVFNNKIQHNLYFEFLGSSLVFYNLTYDCSFKIAEKHKIAAGFGGQYVTLFNGAALYGITPQINYLYGKRHHLELGVGFTFHWEKDLDDSENFGYDYYTFIPMRLGYRYQKEEGGYFWKIAFLVINGDFYPIYDPYFLPWFGVSFGYTFKKRDSW